MKRQGVLNSFVAASLVAVVMGGTSQLQASELTFKFVNPSFGGNPFNSAHLLGIANAQNDFRDPRASDGSSFASTTDTLGDLFARQIQSQLLASLSTRITDRIFGLQSGQADAVQFGNQRVTFSRQLDTITITIIDLSTGAQTVVQVPAVPPDIGTTSTLNVPTLQSGITGATASSTQ